MATKSSIQIPMGRRMTSWWMVGSTMLPYSASFWRPPTNVYETAEGLVIQVEVAGLAVADIHVILRPSRLTVSGFRRPVPSLGNSTACLQVEIPGGSFRSDVDLPWPVRADGVRAAYRDGFIFVELSRSEDGNT